MHTLPLFEERSGFDREALRRKLADLANQNIWIGTSSWKYEGWLGQIYSPDRYLVRGRFSRKRFEAECLAEYAETFPIVCGDFSFYQFPTKEFWRKLFGSAPNTLRYTFKAPEDVTVKIFPKHARYGPKSGVDNPSYLNAAVFESEFLGLLEPYRRQIPAIVLEFGTFSKSSYASVENFLDELDPFLAALPHSFQYAVEVRNEDYLTPQYFECLRRNGVAHVFNSWTRMPPLRNQIAMPGAFTTGFAVARALLRTGRPYEEAVAKFSPYREIQDPNPHTREALRDLIAHARDRREPAYIFVNNRLEGNAPGTIEAL